MIYKPLSIFAGAILAASVSMPVSATTIVFDFLPSGSSADSVGKNGFGNEINFSQDGLSVNVTGWAQTGSSSRFQNAEISQWNTGLGICNQQEGSVLNGNCNGATEHQVDGFLADDYAVFSFTQSVSFAEIVIDPYFIRDRDVEYWIGSVNLGTFDLSNKTEAEMEAISGMGSEVDKTASTSSAPLTLDLDDVSGNVLIIKAQWADDAFKIAGLTVDVDNVQAVPVPAAAWLFGSSLLGLVGLKRRR